MTAAPPSRAEAVSAETLCHELARINEVITAARELVADGQLVNLAPLEGEVARICGALATLSATEARRAQPVLLALMDELDRLAGEMRARQSEYEEELRSLASHRNAARAYRHAPSQKGPTRNSGPQARATHAKTPR